MSLDERLKKSKNKGEEKILTLRMPLNKVTLLEMLAKHYETNVTALLREMIDDAIIKLQHEMLVLSEEAGLKGEKGGEPFNFRYLPDLVEMIAPEIHSDPRFEDFTDIEAHEAMFKKGAELSVLYGLLGGSSFVDSKGVQHEIGGKK